MKTTLVIGLLVLAAVALPAATAHIVINTPIPGSCVAVGIGSPNSEPHGSGSIPPCPSISHGEPAPSLLP